MRKSYRTFTVTRQWQFQLEPDHDFGIAKTIKHVSGHLRKPRVLTPLRSGSQAMGTNSTSFLNEVELVPLACEDGFRHRTNQLFVLHYVLHNISSAFAGANVKHLDLCLCCFVSLFSLSGETGSYDHNVRSLAYYCPFLRKSPRNNSHWNESKSPCNERVHCNIWSSNLSSRESHCR